MHILDTWIIKIIIKMGNNGENYYNNNFIPSFSDPKHHPHQLRQSQKQWKLSPGSTLSCIHSTPE